MGKEIENMVKGSKAKESLSPKGTGNSQGSVQPQTKKKKKLTDKFTLIFTYICHMC